MKKDLFLLPFSETFRSIERNRFKTNQINNSNNKRDVRNFCNIVKTGEILEKICAEKTKLRNTHIWTDFEQVAAFHCLVRFDWDYDAVAEVIGNKTPDMVRAFANENRAAIERVSYKQQHCLN